MAGFPNRSKEVKAIVARYPQAFGPPDATLDARRRLLIPIIVRELNKLDGDKWFVLNRLDRQDDDPKPGRLTSDVIVWGPTKEHIDVLSSSGAMWGEQPPITDPDWKLEHSSNWPSWDDVTPVPPVVPPVVPPQPPSPVFDPSSLETAIRELRSSVGGQTEHLATLERRVTDVEQRPAPAFELPELVVEGNTDRFWGHGHSVNLTVRKA